MLQLSRAFPAVERRFQAALKNAGEEPHNPTAPHTDQVQPRLNLLQMGAELMLQSQGLLISLRGAGSMGHGAWAAAVSPRSWPLDDRQPLNQLH